MVRPCCYFFCFCSTWRGYCRASRLCCSFMIMNVECRIPVSYTASISKRMKNMVKYCINKNAPPAFVLDVSTPEDVGRAMIENSRQKQPFFIFDIDEAFRRIQHFRDLMPRVKLFYAMKANDTEMFLKFAISQRTGFSSMSPGEIYKLRKLNINPKSIIYSNTIKTPEQMRYARKTGISHTTFDSSIELKKLVEHWPDAQLLIHVRIESENQNNLEDKFGCNFNYEAITLLEEAANFGLKVVGVKFNVGPMCNSLEKYILGLKYAKALFDHEARAGRRMNILDIGGGFRSDRTDSIDQLSTLLNATLEELFPDPSIQVIAEPGRYLCDSAFTLYCSISNVRRVKKEGKLINMVYMNDGLYGTLRFTEEWHTVSKFKRTTEQNMGELEDTILWGPSCDSVDRVMKNFPVRLPRCIPLDWLIFQNVGAYTITFSSKFSSLEIPLIRPVVSLELWNMIKDRHVFTSNDFIVDPDISSPLPVTLPPPTSYNIFEHTHTPKLKV